MLSPAQLKLYNRYLKNIFVGYNSNDPFSKVAHLKGHIPDRLYRRAAWLMHFHDCSEACIFTTRQLVHLHMLGLSANKKDLLKYGDALKFAISYCKSQCKENEIPLTLMGLCENYPKQQAMMLASYGHKYALNATEENNGITLGVYVFDKRQTELAELAGHRKFSAYVNKRYTKAQIFATKMFKGKIIVAIDEILFFLYCCGIPFTKEILMFRIDCTLGHERMHKQMDSHFSEYIFVKKHWKPAYNLANYKVIEQICNRAGLMTAVKQLHVRKKLNKE